MDIQEKTSKIIFKCKEKLEEKNNVKTLILPKDIDIDSLNAILKEHKEEDSLILVYTVKSVDELKNNIPKCTDLKIYENQTIFACIDITKLKPINNEKIENSEKMDILLEFCKTIEEEKKYEHGGIYAKPIFYEETLKNIKYDKDVKKYKPRQNDKIIKNGYMLCIEEINSDLIEKPKSNENKLIKILNSAKNPSIFSDIAKKFFPSIIIFILELLFQDIFQHLFSSK